MVQGEGTAILSRGGVGAVLGKSKLYHDCAARNKVRALTSVSVVSVSFSRPLELL